MNFLPNFFQGHQMMPRVNSHRKATYFATLKSYKMFGKPELEYGNKVFLPPSALNLLSNQHVPSPMMFCLQNNFENRMTFVGVLEFIAEEGNIILPSQIFQNLNLQEGQSISVALNPEIPRGKFIRIQPHETAFIEVPDPRAVLEFHLRNFTCLTEGETITINFNKKDYKLDILSVKPDNLYKCVCIVETDVEIDFAPPLDYQELPSFKKIDSTITYGDENNKKHEKGFAVFQGKGVRLDGKDKPAPNNSNKQIKEDEKKEEYDPRKHKLNNGVKTKIFNEDFEGKKGEQLGKSEAPKNKAPPVNIKKK